MMITPLGWMKSACDASCIYCIKSAYKRVNNVWINIVEMGMQIFSLFQFNINSLNFRLWASTLCLSWWHRCHYCFLIEYIRLESICCFSLSFMLYIISFIVHIISCIASSTMKLKRNMPNNNVVYFVSLRAMRNVLLFFKFIRNYSVILFFIFLEPYSKLLREYFKMNYTQMTLM